MVIALVGWLAACVPPLEDPDDIDWDGDGIRGAFDCDDDRADVNPLAPERCDGIDNDCDGSTACDAQFGGVLVAPASADSGLGAAILAVGDLDGDGTGDLVASSVSADANVPVDSDSGEIWALGGPRWSLVGSAAGVGTSAWSGAALATAGDLDGDGAAEVWAGAPGFEGNGRVYLLDLGSFGVDAPIAVETGASRILDGVGGERLGTSLSALVDVDGTPVLVAGAPDGNAGSGSVYAWSDPFDAAVPVAGADAGGGLGATACAADLDGDGISEVLAGAPAAGRTVILGLPWSGGDDADAPGWTGDRLGAALAAGDLDGDGAADAVAGGAGSLWIFLGGPAFPNSGAASDRADAHVLVPRDAVVATPGDVDADGGGELLVGSPGEDREIQLFDGTRLDPDAGAAWLLAGPWSAAVDLGDALQEYLGSSLYDRFGAAVAPVGDVDADGRADFAIGAPGYAGSAGAVYVVAGSSLP